MVCKEVKTKKYQERKAPPYHANDCKGETKKGNDGELYVSSVDSRGVYKWVPAKRKSSSVKKVSKKGVKQYKILDNGSNPFICEISKTKVEVYRQKIKEEDGVEDYYVDKKILEIPYINVFIGDNLLNDKYSEKKGKYKGNSILIEIKKGEYIYVGHEVYKFETHEKEDIKRYYSPVGNSGVPYPYAVGDNNTYFMLDKKSISNELLDLKKDAYGQFYGLTVKDENKKKAIEKSKKKFKNKLIHKRHIW